MKLIISAVILTLTATTAQAQQGPFVALNAGGEKGGVYVVDTRTGTVKHCVLGRNSISTLPEVQCAPEKKKQF